MINELSDLIGTDRDEALIAAVLAILLVEDDARDPTGLALFGGDDAAGGGARDGEDGFGVPRVRRGEAFEVCEW